MERFLFQNDAVGVLFWAVVVGGIIAHFVRCRRVAKKETSFGGEAVWLLILTTMCLACLAAVLFVVGPFVSYPDVPDVYPSTASPKLSLPPDAVIVHDETRAPGIYLPVRRGILRPVFNQHLPRLESAPPQAPALNFVESRILLRLFDILSTIIGVRHPYY